MQTANLLEPTSPSASALPSPHALRQALPIRPDIARNVERGRSAFRDVLAGRNSRLMVIAGPCSLHDPDEALEYARRLALVARDHSDTLVVAMRTYLERPRTTLGWKGLVRDPDLDGRSDVGRGLRVARELLLDINRLGMPCASELLDPIVARYLDDLIAWGSIGARTAESQTHRELASGFPAPVGVKNGTSGEVQPAIDAVTAARAPHMVLSIDATGQAIAHRTAGNCDAHIVLRGGSRGPNCDRATIERAGDAVARSRAERPVLVDCSHGNSGGDFLRQPAVALELLRPRSPRLAGVLIESNLRSGKQSWSPGEPLATGLSITDSCLGWNRTEGLLRELAEALRRAGSEATGMP